MSREDELISVVVPVYHVETYIERCVESLLQQTYSNLEIILVDLSLIHISEPTRPY